MALPLNDGAVAPAEIDRIAGELGLTLAHEEQRQYLSSLATLDIQAAPGCGKTTLTSAKLCLLAGAWQSSTQGVCVLSHTNVAKDEILSIVSGHRAGKQLTGYPHFIGTIQSFVNTFLALPALKAKGAEITAIDDDVYSRVAYKRLQHSQYTTLRNYANARHNIEPAILSATFTFRDGSLIVEDAPGLGGESPSARQFAALKRELADKGYYRYADMYALAAEYLHSNPTVLGALRERFPLVIIDEAQDTDGVQNELLCSLFRCPEVVFQRIGDVNQAIFEDHIPADDSAFPSTDALDFPQSMRFGDRIASAASALTISRPLRIMGNPDRGEGHLLLLLFDEGTATEVQAAFLDEVKRRVPEDEVERYGVKVLSARRKCDANKFPRDLGSYGLSLADSKSGTSPANLWELTVPARDMAKLCGDTHASSERVWRGVSEALERKAVDYDGKRPTRRRVLDQLWKAGAAALIDAKEDLFKLLYQSRDQADWDRNVQALFSRLPKSVEQPAPFSSYVEWRDTEESPGEPQAPEDDPPSAQVAVATETVHGAKGETHAATLMVEGWKKVFDLKEVLPIFLNQHNKSRFVKTKEIQPAARRVFVAMTRARHLVGFAVYKPHGEPFSRDLENAGWIVRDLTT